MKKEFKKIYIVLATFFLLALWAVGVFSPALIPIPSRAETGMETTITEDLQELDLSGYPKNTQGTFRIMDEVGFMEYAYTENEELAKDNFNLYFYVYNPTEKEISTSGENYVLMAQNYGSTGFPLSYGKFPLSVLSCTENRRFYKLCLSDSSVVYESAFNYAQERNERRYDIAGLALHYKGEELPRGEYFTTDTGEHGITYFCSGFAKGCGIDPQAESTLAIECEELETVKLNVDHTFYRSETSAAGSNYQNQLDTVYFSVSNALFAKYGNLQRIKAEWYEYKTKPVLVTDSEERYEMLSKLIGYTLPRFSDSDGWNELKTVLTEEEYKTLRSACLGQVQPVYDYAIGNRLFYLFYSEDGGDISSEALEKYILSYDKTFDNGNVQYGDRLISADLFEQDIDESRKVDNAQGRIRKGYSFYDFDIDVDLQEMIAWKDGVHSDFIEWFYKTFNMYPTEDSRSFAPIYVLQAADLIGNDETVAERLMIQKSEVANLKHRYRTAQKNGEQVILFRFAVSDYMSYRVSNGLLGGMDSYISQQSVYLDFKIIQLTFNRDGVLKVIPTVMNPISIINALEKPAHVTTAGWWDNVTDFFGRLFTGDLKWWEWILFVVYCIIALIVLAILVFVVVSVIRLIKFIIKQISGLFEKKE